MTPARLALLIGGLVMLGLVGAAAWLYSPLPDNPPPDALRAGSQAYDVEIIRDAYGVPHVYGRTDADAVFGLAYAHAEDDFETIQLTVAAGRGVLARYQGAGAAPTDYLVNLMGVWDTMAARYERDVPADVRALAEAYAAGVNLYAAEHPDATWRGLAPFTAQDVVAGFVFKTPLFYGLDGVLVELLTGDPDRELALAPDASGPAFQVRDAGPYDRGSNAFAVAPHRSGDGVTRLFINSHQPFEGPVAWYEARLHSQEGLDIAGGVFPGAPIILHGWTPHLGWANTVNDPDLIDVYQLVLDPDTPDAYMLDGVSTPMEVTRATIDVKLWGPFVYRAHRPVKRARHGPVIERDGAAYAIRYAGMGEVGQMEQYVRLNKAASMEDWLAAMSAIALPSINYVFAGADGTVGLIYNGQFPNRAPGWDWLSDLPGDRSDLIWEGYRGFEELPQIINPPSGFIFNSNNTPATATDGPDNIDLADLPADMGVQSNETNRAIRILELTGAGRPIGRERLLAIKYDVGLSPTSFHAARIDELLALDLSDDPELAAAQEHLVGFDMTADLEDRHAALAMLSILEAVTEQYTGNPTPAPRDAFARAVALLTKNYGRIDPEWGEVNRLVRGDLSLPVSGTSGTLRSIHPAAIRDDGRLHATAGDTWIALVEWDGDGGVTAHTVHQYGSATLDAASPHYDDQAALFAGEELRLFPFSREAVLAEATARYRPGD